MNQIRLATKVDFDDVLAQGDFSTLDWEFIEASSSILRRANVSVCVERGGGKYVVPLLERRVLKLYPVAESLPYGLYGGVFPLDQHLDALAYADIIQEASGFLKMGIVFQNPFHQSVLSQTRLSAVVGDYAHMVLTEGKVYNDMLAKAFEHKMRKNIKRALQNNVTIQIGRSPELVRDFFRVYQLSNVRWGRSKPRYGLDFFRSYAEHSFFEIRVAYCGEKPAAALAMLKFRNYYFGWFGGMNKELSNTRANDLLHADLLKWSIENGIKYVNFGSSGHLAGVRKFKQSFGASEHTYKLYFVGNPVAKAALRLKLGARS